MNTTAMSTTIVELTTSLRVGHATFSSSDPDLAEELARTGVLALDVRARRRARPLRRAGLSASCFAISVWSVGSCGSCHGVVVRFICGSEQGRRDSNPQPPVLETGALPIELLPSGTGRRTVEDSSGTPRRSVASLPGPYRRRRRAHRATRRSGRPAWRGRCARATLKAPHHGARRSPRRRHQVTALDAPAPDLLPPCATLRRAWVLHGFWRGAGAARHAYPASGMALRDASRSRERGPPTGPGERAPRRRWPRRRHGAADRTHVGEALAREHGADRPLLGRLSDRCERLAQHARRRLEVLGAQELEAPEHPAVAGELGLAAQARLDVRAAPSARRARHRRPSRAGRGRPLHTARADLPSVSSSRSRRRFRPRCRRTFGRRDRDPGLGGDVVVRQAVDVLEDHRRAHRRRQLVERGGDVAEPRGRGSEVVGAGVEADVGLLGHVVEVHRATSACGDPPACTRSSR